MKTFLVSIAVISSGIVIALVGCAPDEGEDEDACHTPEEQALIDRAPRDPDLGECSFSDNGTVLDCEIVVLCNRFDEDQSLKEACEDLCGEGATVRCGQGDGCTACASACFEYRIDCDWCELL